MLRFGLDLLQNIDILYLSRRDASSEGPTLCQPFCSVYFYLHGHMPKYVEIRTRFGSSDSNPFIIFCLRTKKFLLSLTGLILHGGNKGDCLHAHWSLPWCPWNAPVVTFNVLIWCPLHREKVPWCPLSKTKHTCLPLDKTCFSRV